MDMKEIKDWFLKMGYDPHKMPEDGAFVRLSRGPLGPVWHEIITKIKPKSETNVVKKNVLLHSIKNSTCNYKPKKLQIFEEHQNLKAELNAVVDKINKLQSKLKNDLANSKIKALKEDKLRNENDDLKKKIFLLKEKTKKIRNASEENSKNKQEFEIVNLDKKEVQSRIGVILEFLDELDQEESLKVTAATSIKSHANSKNGSLNKTDAFIDGADFFSVNNFLFSNSKIRENNKKLGPIIKQKLENIDFSNIWEAFSEIQNELVSSISQISNEKPENTAEEQDLDTEYGLAELYAVYNYSKIMGLKYKHATSQYENLNEKYLSAIEDPKERFYVSLIIQKMDLKTSVEIVKQEFEKLNEKLSLNHTLKNINILSEIEKVQTKIEINEKLIKDRYSEITPFMEDSLQLQPIISKTHSMFKFDCENARSNVLCDGEYSKELEIFCNFPLQFNLENYFSFGNTWKCFLNDPSSENFLLHLVNKRPEIIVFKLFRLFLEKNSLDSVNNLKILDNCQLIANFNYDLNIFPTKNTELINTVENALMNCHNLSMVQRKKEVLMEFWFNQKWRTVVCSSRLFNGQNLQYYEKLFSEAYKRIEKRAAKKNQK